LTKSYLNLVTRPHRLTCSMEWRFGDTWVNNALGKHAQPNLQSLEE